MNNPEQAPFAAVDLGSNSFHMVVAKVENGQLRVVDKLREQVQLGLGMGADKRIHADAWARGLACLANFGQRLRGIPAANCRIVGTNTLRRAVNGEDFVEEANRLLGHEIEIISGREEARLIYEGVLHDAAEPGITRLVIDIGGGSTELIVGHGFDPAIMESISVGCVSMSQRFFADGALSKSAFRRASDAALMELHPVLHKYRAASWQQAVGCSGTIKAIDQTCSALGISAGEGFSAGELDQLAHHMRAIGRVDRLDYDLAERRLNVLAGGVAVLQALFKALRIEHMQVSSTALREGVIYDLHGREHHDDVQQRSVQHIAEQYHVNAAQAARVVRSTESLLRACSGAAPLDEGLHKQLLFAAQLYELGWVVAHSQYHRHGHYLLAHADMRGFSHTEQQLLANWVRYHRRKLPQPLAAVFSPAQQRALLMLRLAVILNRDRVDREEPALRLALGEEGVRLLAPQRWLQDNPLSAAELAAECQEWARVGVAMHLEAEDTGAGRADD